MDQIRDYIATNEANDIGTGHYRSGKHNPNNMIIDTTNRKFEGEEPGIRAVLGLIIENIDKKAPLDIFREILSKYIVRTINTPEFFISVVCDMIDSGSYFDNDNKPKNLTDEEKKSDVNTKIHQQRIKIYITRELGMKSNMNKIHCLVWEQCTYILQSMIKHENYYRDKPDNFDTLCLLKKIKQINSVIYSRSNKILKYHEALMGFLTMRKITVEGDGEYMKRIKVNLDTLILIGGIHVLCRPDLV